ncbi:MAG: hypothetical protein ACJAUZ_000062 [Flavobacteriaceae bacterium]
MIFAPNSVDLCCLPLTIGRRIHTNNEGAKGFCA